MAGVGPLGLAAAVRAVASALDRAQVGVIGLDGRNTYPHESTYAWVTVSVHLESAPDVDHVADVLGLDPGSIGCDNGLYSRAGDWLGRVHVSLFSAAKPRLTVLGVVS